MTDLPLADPLRAADRRRARRARRRRLDPGRAGLRVRPRPPGERGDPTSLLVVAITAATAAWAHVRAGTVWMRTAVTFASVGVVGSFMGAWLGHRVDGAVVLGGLAVLMVVASVGMWRRGGRRRLPCPT